MFLGLLLLSWGDLGSIGCDHSPLATPVLLPPHTPSCSVMGSVSNCSHSCLGAFAPFGRLVHLVQHRHLGAFTWLFWQPPAPPALPWDVISMSHIPAAGSTAWGHELSVGPWGQWPHLPLGTSPAGRFISPQEYQVEGFFWQRKACI